MKLVGTARTIYKETIGKWNPVVIPFHLEQTGLKKVCYFYHPEVGNYYYGGDHPMKPHRIRMTHALLKHYGLLQQMKVYKPKLAREKDLFCFHVDDCLFIENNHPRGTGTFGDQLSRLNIGLDCPVLDNLYSFCRTYAEGSIGRAVMLNYGHCDIAVSWAGGFWILLC